MKGQPGTPRDGSSFSEKFSCGVHMTFMLVNKYNKEFQHFLFLCSYYFKLTFMIIKVICACKDSKSATCLDTKDGNYFLVPHSFPTPNIM